MCENLCRICGKAIDEKDPTNLFENHNKTILVQIKDLTGVRLKNNPTLPKFMCCVCKKDLIDAYKFREDFLKVQQSFRINGTKGSRRHTNKKFIEATEFVQVIEIKEEKNIYTDNEDTCGGEEKEINITDSINLNKKEHLSKDNKDEVNALELKPSEENALEDTKVAINELNKKVNVADDISQCLSEDENNENIESDEEFIPKTRKSKKFQYTTTERENIELERKVNKSLKKRKGDIKHQSIFMCDQCGNNFTCRHHFKLHLRRHSGDKRCACELCPDKFFTSSELRRHMRKHTGERPFACRHCDRRFTDYSTRLKHERTHTNERPFMCSQCGKSFTTSYILKNHMLTHTGERHFKCDVCNRAFTRRTHLLVHFRSMMHKQAVEKEKRAISQEDFLNRIV